MGTGDSLSVGWNAMDRALDIQCLPLSPWISAAGPLMATKTGIVV